ncbi:PREDICTED: G protein-activated inward rectifier potassium channel 3-like [Rhagoletis zephyria]|uniref:G protein-activated inward rectifier potassium channel 3-like n=1 Tax=Rhagoletis zephyria TaxID=28612 RepID=UPI000811504B|nr:PREDICTED: G protein-activated inward rectifier potassium channel 3-like [Rhagoletis zephyria]
MSSSHSGQPLGEGLQEEEEDEDEGGVEDQDEEEEEDNVDEEDANNNPLVEVHSPNHQLTTNTFERTLKITPSIVRRLPIRSGDKRFPGRIRKRVIHKNGNVNLSPEHVDKRHRRFMQDMFTTMVDIRWRWNLLVFTMGFLISWFSFAVVWWLIAFSHSDFEHPGDLSWSPCVNNLNSFASAILFSIETQHTIGYGSRYTTEECPEAMFVMCLQSITGVMIQCFMVGFVFAKLSRPQKRSQTLMFSRHAVTCLRDGKLCLMFRVGDLRDKSHIIGAAISAQLIRRRVTEEGEVIPYYHQSLSVRFDDAGTDLFLIWPAVIIHEINSESPFYMMNCEAMMKEKFEIVVILEGTVESTGQSVQARTSYLPAEILWGHRFEQLVQYRNDSGEFTVDYSKFNNTFPVDIATYSGKEFHEDLLHRERQRQHQYGTPPTSPPTSPPTTTGNGQQYSTGGRPSIPPPPPSQLLTESQRERIKFYEH